MNIIKVSDKFITAKNSCDIFPTKEDFYLSNELKSQFKYGGFNKKISLCELVNKVNKTVINIYEPKDYYATERAMISLNAYKNLMGRKTDSKYEPMRAEYDLIINSMIEENAMLEERLRTNFYDTEVLADFRKAVRLMTPYVCRCRNCMRIEFIIRKRNIEKAKETIDRNTQYLKHYNN